ncbi:MAG: hypothetical protein M1839_002948, partial [Geoglossum umbratile]
LAKNIIAFTILADGIPIIYQGQEHHFDGSSDPTNREALWPTLYATTTPLYQHISILNRLRRHAISQSQGQHSRTRSTVLYSDHSTLVVRKGDVLSVYSNAGESAVSRLAVGVVGGWAAREALVEIIGCTVRLMDSGGRFSAMVESGLPAVRFVSAQH